MTDGCGRIRGDCAQANTDDLNRFLVPVIKILGLNLPPLSDSDWTVNLDTIFICRQEFTSIPN